MAEKVLRKYLFGWVLWPTRRFPPRNPAGLGLSAEGLGLRRLRPWALGLLLVALAGLRHVASRRLPLNGVLRVTSPPAF